ncbi:MAG: AMP-binding protein, partial [Chromatiaceae bacterium]|nr:AMP-binding protein [Chromatiaceae bacterium]
MSKSSQHISAIAQATGVSREEIEQVYGLSPLQQGMLLYTLRERKGMYISQGSVVQQEIDVAARQKAWQFMVARHAILRTSFHWENLDNPVQIVHRDVSIPFTVLDWRHIPAREQHQRLRQFLQQDLESGFDPTKPALFRHTIIRLTQNRWQVIDTHHHIILDGWSGRTVGAELAKVYRAFVQGSTPTLPEVMPFRAYIDWISAHDERQSEDFWRTELLGIKYPTPLPADKGIVKETQRKPPKSWSIELKGEALTALEQTAKDFQVSLNVLLVAAWAYLLSRYARQASVVFGLLVSGRPPSLAGVESMVGMFLNTLPFRVTIDPNLPLADWLREIQSHQNKLREYEHSPLVQVQRWSEVPAGAPLFESMISRHFDAQGAARKPTTKRTGKEKGNLSTFQQNYPLLWNFAVKDGLRMMLTYDVQRFETPDIARIVEQLRNVLVSMTEHHQSSVGALQIMTPREHDKIVSEWGQGAQTNPLPMSLLEIFEHRAREFPDRTALWYSGQKHSYLELDRIANRVAHFLQVRGVESRQIVIVYGSQSVEAIVTLLAVLKIGATCLPLGVRCKREILTELARQPNISALITDPVHAEHLSGLALAPIEIDLSFTDALPEEASLLDHTVDANTLARVLVKPPLAPNAAIELFGLTHAAALHRASVLPVHAPVQGQPSSTAILQALDGTLFQDMLVSCWMRGETLILLGDALPGEAERIADILAQAKPQRVCMAPRQLRGILVATTDSSLPFSKDVHLVCCAEPLPEDLVAQLRHSLPAAHIDNLYGTLECGSAICRRLPEGAEVSGSTSIGTPLAGTCVHILDSLGKPVAPGMPGELFLSSPGIANQILYDTNDTINATPLQDAFDTDRQALMVATGDIGCWMSDGTVGLFGQADQCRGGQGLPLAAGAVERLLRQVAGIRDAVLLLHRDDRVLAYLEASAGVDPKRVVADLVPAMPIGTHPETNGTYLSRLSFLKQSFTGGLHTLGFSAISSSDDHARAHAAGPPCVAA